MLNRITLEEVEKATAMIEEMQRIYDLECQVLIDKESFNKKRVIEAQYVSIVLGRLLRSL